MGVGKYSPTVSTWYRRDRKWHERHCEPGRWIDRDGYDSYGYHHETELDRAGYSEWDYLGDGKWVRYGDDEEEYVYQLYEMIACEWRDRPWPWEKVARTD